MVVAATSARPGRTAPPGAVGAGEDLAVLGHGDGGFGAADISADQNFGIFYRLDKGKSVRSVLSAATLGSVPSGR